MLVFKPIVHRGLEEAIREAEERITALQEGVEADLEWFGRTASDEMVETHTFQNRTFRLETSIGYELYRFHQSQVASVEVHALADYASQVEYGHPGPPPARPYPFFWPVFWSRVPLLWDRLKETLDRALGGT